MRWRTLDYVPDTRKSLEVKDVDKAPRRTRSSRLRCGRGASGVLPDELLDALDRAFRRLRHGMVRPPTGQVPVPALGHQLDVAKVIACDALAELSSARATIAVKDVAHLLDLEHSTVSRLLGECEADGLVVRSQDPLDRRRTNVTLTDLGAAVVSEGAQLKRRFMRLVLADWPRSDVDELERLVTQLGDSLGERTHEALAELLPSGTPE